MNSKAPTPPPTTGDFPSIVRPLTPPPPPPRRPASVSLNYTGEVVTSVRLVERGEYNFLLQQRIINLATGEARWEDVPTLPQKED